MSRAGAYANPALSIANSEFQQMIAAQQAQQPLSSASYGSLLGIGANGQAAPADNHVLLLLCDEPAT